jgi:hypothetical protein
MAQEKQPNVMGDVTNNQGIVTQGQIGDNYIIQFKAPTISVIGQLPPTKNPDGTFNLQLVFRIVSQSPANRLTVAVMKDDVAIPPNGPSIGSVDVSPRDGIAMQSASEQDGFLWRKIQSPSAGEYVVNTKVRSEDVKPRIQLQVE